MHKVSNVEKLLTWSCTEGKCKREKFPSELDRLKNNICMHSTEYTRFFMKMKFLFKERLVRFLETSLRCRAKLSTFTIEIAHCNHILAEKWLINWKELTLLKQVQKNDQKRF